MLNKKILLMLVIFFVSLLAVSTVSAADNGTDDIISDTNNIEDYKIINENSNDDRGLSSIDEDDDVLGASPPYNKYSVSVSDTTITYGSSGSIVISVTSCSGYDYKYDFYLKVYDSSNNLKINKNYYSSSSTTKITHSIGTNELSVGTYTIKLVNYADSHVMDTAKLTVKSSSSSTYTYPYYNSYSVSVSDTTINYGSSGSISMSISPASSSYKYKYDFYLKVYDSNNNVKINQEYYSTSSATSKTYTVSANQLNPGTYTIKIVNYYDNNVMDTAKLTVKNNYPPSTAYSVSVSDTTINYGSSGSISMSISSASSSYNYKYYYYLRIYDSNSNQKVSQLYYSTSSATSKTYSISANQLNPGTYTIKIVNYYDSKVMDTAKLTVKALSLTSSSYSVTVSDKNINYGSTNSISMSISPASSGYNYKYDFYLKIYDSHHNLKVNQRYYSTNSDYSKIYSISSYLGIGTYTIKIVNYYDGNVMDTATLKIVKGSTHVKCNSFKTKIGSKTSISAYIYDNSNSRKNVGGTAIVKINGKTYKLKVNNGIAKIKNIKFPLKVKTYKGSVKYLGDKNHKASSAKFKIFVKKLKSYMGSYAPFAKVGTKAAIYAWVYIKDFNGNVFPANSGKVKFNIAGNTYYAKVKNGEAKLKIYPPYNAKTYYCKAVYLGTKSVKSNSDKFKLTVKKPTHTYYRMGFKFTLSDSQYKKIQYVKKHKYDSPDRMAGHKVFYKVKTNKYYNNRPVYASIETHRSIFNHKFQYVITYDFYVFGYGYIIFGKIL